jgi:hypothetical protein
MSDSYVPMDTGSIYDWLAMQQQVYPEWVGGAGKNAHYAPPDIGSQASQLNYLQDTLNSGMDPLMGLMSGGFNPESFASTFEDDEVVQEANTQGTDTLRKIVTTSPGSVEGYIAARLLEGGTAEQAIDDAVEQGLINVPEIRNPQSGQMEPDERGLERYRKLATDLWTKQLGDQEEIRNPGKEILHPFVQRAIDAGLGDPRQQYTADFINPGLSTERVGRDNATASAMDVMRSSIAGQKRLDAMPTEAQVQGGQDAQSRAGKVMRERVYGPQENVAWLTSDGTRLGDFPANLVAPNPDPGSQRAAARQITAARKKDAAVADQKKKATNASRVTARAGNAQGAYRRSEMKTNAAAGALQRAGRTPFLDNFAARMEAIAARGVGQ